MKDAILQRFREFFAGTGGIDSWLTDKTPGIVFERLAEIDKGSHLSRAQFNQLLLLSHEAGMSQDFFNYYWLSTPGEHPYDVKRLGGYQDSWSRGIAIQSIDHLRWGLYRFYVDALLFFGNVRTAYRTLRTLRSTRDSIADFFSRRRFDAAGMQQRGAPLEMRTIARDDRYLISEMACKSYGNDAVNSGELRDALHSAFGAHTASGGGRVLIRDLLDGAFKDKKYADSRQQLLFSAEAFLDEEVASEAELTTKYAATAKAFNEARDAALHNTKLYLSMVDELDVYVATSMRTREDFRKMAGSCERIFADPRLTNLHLRYFDPTMSAAEGHEDKGLIECLMVKCAKALVYFAGDKESYGKDAEAAMALSQGKPVIFLCNEEQRSRFYREVHPLSRLIDFESGVPVGAMVTTSEAQVSELLYRIFENKMEYELEQTKPGYLRLVEALSKSVVRLQTSDELLRETFWNYYHNRR